MYHNLLKILKFLPKENSTGIFEKEYPQWENYAISIDFDKEIIDFGKHISAESKATQNFSQTENWVVLECVDRLLEKGYSPKDIILEKVFPSGHGHSGRLDILVEKEGKAFLMIECKTWGKEFEKESKNIHKNGGQLFTYFQNDTRAEVLMLYTSQLLGNEVDYKCEVIKIEPHYREAGNVEDVFDRWNKVTFQNGIFEEWVKAYNYANKLLTGNDLIPLKEEDSGKVFHAFLSILRKHTISDKPNAFNKIFNLFLAKIFDEKKPKNKPLDFQWKEGQDDAVEFQVRLINLYKAGMYEFLKKEIEGINDDDFSYKDKEDLKAKKKKWLKYNQVFAIKEVMDDESFEDNHKVLKEVVELLQNYQIRYPRKQQHLSNFFERLLTTGLKQEAGQFFTPIPIARFIVKSLPLPQMLQEAVNQEIPKLPAVIDYAVGSGHFITEMMEEYQHLIDKLETNSLGEDASKKVKSWQIDQYNWASKYIYGIENDYRLVKTAKVGCYFYGDGLAQVIHGDGLDSFEHSKTFRGLLEDNAKSSQFDIVVSNPPYSVSAFKGNLKNKKANEDFELFDALSDRSSEIECLFVERTKHLLKENGIAGIVLPSSILSNTGIYTKTRELILQDFEIIAIAEFGSNTFMATGTNTVTLFLRKRKATDRAKTQESLHHFFTHLEDITFWISETQRLENAVSKYVNQVWENIEFEDYISLLKKDPNEAIQKHEIYQEYQKKLKAKDDKAFWEQVLELEKEKLLYFVLAYPQKVVLVKTGQKKEEKRFLGYEFSNRRGSEGIHPIQRGKTIAECTQLFEEHGFENPAKASHYIYHAFQGSFEQIPEELEKNISYQNLADMMTFDRSDFQKNISLALKKKVAFESKWEMKRIGEVVEVEYGTRIVKQTEEGSKYPVYGGGGETFKADKFNRENRFIISRFGMSPKCVRYVNGKFFLNDSGFTVKAKNTLLNESFLDYFLLLNQEMVYLCGRGVAQKNIDFEQFNNFKIPLPSKEIQEKIVAEIEVLEKQESEAKEEIEKLREQKMKVINEVLDYQEISLLDITSKIGSGATPRGGEGSYKTSGITFIRSQNIYDDGFVEKGLVFIDEEQAKKLNNVTVEPNDVLFNITGASVARCCLVEDKYLPARVNQHVSIIRCNNQALSKFIQQILISPQIKEKLLAISKNATSREAITKIQLENFKIPLPPLSAQEKIVADIEELENQIQDLERQLEQMPQEKEAILKKYL